MATKTLIQFFSILTVLQLVAPDGNLSAEQRSSSFDYKQENSLRMVTLSVQLNGEHTFSDLSDCWAVSMINHLIAKRISLETEPSFDFANTLSNLTIHTSMDAFHLTLQDLVHQIENLENDPITEQELRYVKAEARQFLEELYHDLDHVADESIPKLVSNLEFFDQSMQCLENIDLANINEVMSMLQPYDSYQVAYTAPREIHPHPVQTLVQFQNAFYDECQESSHQHFSLDTGTDEGLQIQFTSAEHIPSGDPFLSLPVAQWEVDMIRKIINTMGDKNLVQLLMKKKEMKKMGKKIHQVHPLKFLEVVFSNSKTSRSMREVKKSSFKWDAFIDGFSDKINGEHNHNNVVPYLHGFCASLDVDYDKVLNYVSKREWKHLVQYLIDAS